MIAINLSWAYIKLGYHFKNREKVDHMSLNMNATENMERKINRKTVPACPRHLQPHALA
jgi:hypothetical protein